MFLPIVLYVICVFAFTCSIKCLLFIMRSSLKLAIKQTKIRIFYLYVFQFTNAVIYGSCHSYISHSWSSPAVLQLIRKWLYRGHESQSVAWQKQSSQTSWAQGRLLLLLWKPQGAGRNQNAPTVWLGQNGDVEETLSRVAESWPAGPDDDDEAKAAGLHWWRGTVQKLVHLIAAIKSIRTHPPRKMLAIVLNF